MTMNIGAMQPGMLAMSPLGSSSGAPQMPPLLMNMLMQGVSQAMGAQNFGAMLGSGNGGKLGQLLSMEKFASGMGGGTNPMQMFGGMGGGFSPLSLLGGSGGGFDPLSLLGMGAGPMSPKQQELQSMQQFTEAMSGIGGGGGDDEDPL